MKLLTLLAAIDIDTSSLPKAGTDPNSNVLINVLNIVFGVLAGIAFISVVYGGFKYVISQGEPDKIGKAKNIIMYSIVGLVIAMSAFGIVNLLLKVLE